MSRQSNIDFFFLYIAFLNDDKLNSLNINTCFGRKYWFFLGRY